MSERKNHMNTIGTKIDEVRIDGCMESFKQDLERIRRMGIKVVELPVHGLDAILNGMLIEPRMAKILNLLKEYEFSYSVHAPNPLNLMDKKQPELHSDVFLASLEFTRRIGAKILVYHPGRFIPEEEFNIFPLRSLSAKEKEFLMDREAVLLESVARQYPDITIAMENARPYISQSPYTYAESIEELKKQVNRINRDNIRINLDIGHLHMTSQYYGYDILSSVSFIKSLISHTHIHDNFGGAVHHYEKQQTHQLPFGRGDSHMPVGLGNIPVKGILEILLPEYTGLLMMELRSRYFHRIKASKEELEEIQKELGEINAASTPIA